MIKFGDSAMLALTKLRTKPARTIITILLASLLFGVLVTASLVMTGALTSLDSFREDGLTKRHIMSSDRVINTSDIRSVTRDKVLIAEAKERYEQLVKDKTAEAKRLNVQYSQISDPMPYAESGDGSGDIMLNIGDRNGIVRQLLAEKYANTPAFDDTKLTVIAKRYGAIGVFSAKEYSLPGGSTLDVLKDGKEEFRDQTDAMLSSRPQETPPIQQFTKLTPPETSKPFMLPNNAGWQPDGASLPLVLPQDSIEYLLGLKAPAKGATTKEKLGYLVDVRERASNLSVTACYRNDASNALIQQAIQQQKEIKANAGKKGYIKPTVVYELPDASSCSDPIVVSDTRTGSQKLQDANQKTFDEKFNNYTESNSHFVTFKIVGVSPSLSAAESGGGQLGSLGDVVNNLLQTYGIGQAIPQHLYDQLPNKDAFSDILSYSPAYVFGNEDNQRRYVEFASAADAQRFMTEQGCTVQVTGSCTPVGRSYMIAPEFSNSSAIDDIQTKAREWFNYALIGIIALAAIIMWIAVGRTMSDSRRETAIFRAIGFKRGDIAGTYILYAAMLSTLIAVFAVGIGVLGAYIVDRLYAPDLTVQAQYGFGALDLTKQVSLIGIDYRQLGLVLAACLVTGLLSVIIPLLRNVRRNPIRDMRDEA